MNYTDPEYREAASTVLGDSRANIHDDDDEGVDPADLNDCHDFDDEELT